MGVGEGGGELVKQLLRNTWDINAPEVVLVWLEGKPRHGVGPHDVAISLVKATFESGFVKNKVLEFAGPGVKDLPIDFRNGIDVMTTETTCLSSIWITDEKVKEYFDIHERPEAYKKLEPGKVAYYDSMIRIDLSTQECMIALPFHPSNAYTIHELQADPEGILKKVEEDTRKRFGDKVQVDLVSKIKDGKVVADQALIAGCSGGTYDNLSEAATILKGKNIGNDYFTMSCYPQSTPVYLATTRNHIAEELLEAGVVIKPAFCGPCFGAGDVPANNGFSIRHTTRNFPNREGSKPGQGQISLVSLMDARSIAATAANGDGHRVRRHPQALHLRRPHLQEPHLLRLRQGRPLRGTPLWSEHQGLAHDVSDGGEHAPGTRRRHPRPGDHHRRAHPFGRDFQLPFQPAQAQ